MEFPEKGSKSSSAIINPPKNEHKETLVYFTTLVMEKIPAGKTANIVRMSLDKSIQEILRYETEDTLNKFLENYSKCLVDQLKNPIKKEEQH